MKLTQLDRQAIRESYDMGCSQNDLAEHFGVSQAHISRVLRSSPAVKKLTSDQVQSLRYEAKTSRISQVELGAKYGVTQGEISRILSGALYGNVEPSPEEVELQNTLTQYQNNIPVVEE